MKHPLFLLLIISFNVCAQTTIAFDSPRWKIEAKEAVKEEYLGKQCLKITNGTALLQDAHFKNGIIEFDMVIEHGRYFPGIDFRVQSAFNAEAFYVRPHQSGNPDAMQYYPEYNDNGSWQLYYGPGFSSPHNIPTGRWLHITILIKNNRGEIYFDDEKEPALKMTLLRPVTEGMIELQNRWPTPARYANFKYTATDDVTLKTRPDSIPPLPADVITTWQISTPFDEKLVDGKTTLQNFDTSMLIWKTLPTDDRGVADLSKLANATAGKNTVFARLVVDADSDEIKKFTFGFSDRARFYCNGKLLYYGADEYASRDYRFLGTMGFYDAVYLDLKKGHNDIWIAISEDFGGWGVQGKVD